LKGK
jgi:hypothetical protein